MPKRRPFPRKGARSRGAEPSARIPPYLAESSIEPDTYEPNPCESDAYGPDAYEPDTYEPDSYEKVHEHDPHATELYPDNPYDSRQQRHSSPPRHYSRPQGHDNRTRQSRQRRRNTSSQAQNAAHPFRPHYLAADDDEFVPRFNGREGQMSGRFNDGFDYRFWVLGGVLLVGLTILIEPTRVISSIVKTQDYDCQEVVQSRSVLSREQLIQLLAIPERSPKGKVRAVMEEPYCLMPSVMIRAGILTVREAYPLEFDPEMWIVMLYEGDEYAGYRFNAR